MNVCITTRGAGLCPATARCRRWRIERGTNQHVHRRLPTLIKVHTFIKTIFQIRCLHAWQLWKYSCLHVNRHILDEPEMLTAGGRK